MEISDKEIKNLAKLMKLSLSDDEVKKFRGEIYSIVKFISQLNDVDVSNAPAIGNVTEEENNWRKDEIMQVSCSPDVLLDATPEHIDDFIKVPSVFNE